MEPTFYFMKFLQHGPLSEVMIALYRDGSLAKKSPLVADLPLELKYRLVRLASIGIIKFEKGQILPNMKLDEIAA